MAKFVNLESITKYINATFKAENYMIFKKMIHTFGSLQHGKTGKLYTAVRLNGVVGQMKIRQLRSGS